MNDGAEQIELKKYPLSMRVLHWIRAVLVLGLIWAGWTMTGMADEQPEKYLVFYPNHKQFGLLALGVALVQLVIRWRNRVSLPKAPAALSKSEALLSHWAHCLMIALAIAVPVMGYCMSSSFTLSDGVPFFFFGEMPELLPKNDKAFEVFQLLHKTGAYTLLGLVGLHVLGALKHRLWDKGEDTDVLPRML